MLEPMYNTSKLRYALETPDGAQLRSYRLCGGRGQWLGDIALEYSAQRHELRMMVISDYGNYGYRWNACGDKGYARFLLGAANEYITDKMAMGHDEERVLYAQKTCEVISDRLRSVFGDEDADWLGEVLNALNECECEADFYAWASEYDIPDVYTYFRYGWGGWLNGFCAVLLPELKRVLRLETQEEVNVG